MSQELNTEAVELLNTLANALTGKKKKEKKSKGKYVLIVNGKVTSQILKSKKEIDSAVTTLTIRAAAMGQTSPEIVYATITNTVAVELPTITTDTSSVEVK